MAAGLVWTIGLNGVLYGLDPATGRVRQQAAIGTPTNHFPTPSVGDGLLLAASADHVVAFAAPAPGTRTGTAPAAPGTRPTTARVAGPTRQPSSEHHAPGGLAPGGLAAIAVAGLVILAGLGWFVRGQRIRGRN